MRSRDAAPSLLHRALTSAGDVEKRKNSSGLREINFTAVWTNFVSAVRVRAGVRAINDD